jgi:cyclin B
MLIEEQELWEDIDKRDRDDTRAVNEYVNDIYDYFREKEYEDRIDCNYIQNQTEVTAKARAILVDWLVEVHEAFKLIPETLFLSVNLIDKFLSVRNIEKTNLQLLGVTCMLLASKFEENHAPECQDFVYVCDGAYSKDMILQMEQVVVNAIGFNLTTPYALHFLRRFSKAAGSDYATHTLCKFLIELTLIHMKMLKYLPSEIAAGAVYFARKMNRISPTWNPTLEHYTTYTEKDINSCVMDIELLTQRCKDSALQAIRKKYSQDKYGRVAI